jgi:hypothetical protein
MISQELLRQQQDLSPKEDLSPYQGEWVVLRDGYVIAHGPDPVQLRESPDVAKDDAIIKVSFVESQLIV